MTKKEINVFDYAGEIFKALPKGILLTSEAEDCINAVTIGWGSIGIEWGVPIFTAYVRESRFTYELLERTGEFTICAPYGDKYAKEVAEKTKELKTINECLAQLDGINVSRETFKQTSVEIPASTQAERIVDNGLKTKLNFCKGLIGVDDVRAKIELEKIVKGL